MRQAPRHRLKYVARVNMGQSPPSSAYGDAETEMPFLQGNAEFGPVRPTARLGCDAAPKRCVKGDVLLSVRAPVGALNVADQPYGIGRGLCAIGARAIDPHFLWWALHEARDQLFALATGSTYDAVSAEDVAEIRLLVPELAEQRAIVDSLDAAVREVDDIRTLKQRLLETLLERRDAVVADRFRGIASESEERRLKHVTREITVGVVVRPAELYAQEGIPFLRGLNVRRGALRLDDLKFLDREKEAQARKSRLTTGDVVVVRTGNAGAAAVIPPSLDGANCVDLLIVRPKPGLSSGFLELFLNSEAARAQVRAASVGALQAHFNVEALRELRLPVPPVDRQAEVAKAVDKDLELHDGLIADLRKQLDVLNERRTALIAETVAGGGVPALRRDDVLAEEPA